MFDRVSSNFYTCDADVYSWLDVWKIKGFDTIDYENMDEDYDEEEASLPAIPVILDDPKTRILRVCQKVKQP